MHGTISTEQALIYTMVTMSGVEGKINAIELAEIRQLVQTLPIFSDFDEHRLLGVAQEAGEILQDSEGLKAILGLIKGVWLALANGYKTETGNLAIDQLVSSGGMDSMLNTIWLVITALAFGGVVEKAGVEEANIRPHGAAEA